MHRRRRQALPLLISQENGKAAVHHADERVGGAEIDAEDE